MLYKVIKYFGPEDPGWKTFAGKHWIQPFLSFDSVDGIVCPDVFLPVTAEDWDHCVQEDYRTSLISDLDHALRFFRAHQQTRLVGVEEKANCDHQRGLLGYDILEGDNYVSLVTNWGPHDIDHPLLQFPVGSNGLMESYETATRAAELLKKEYSSDEHASGSTVWAIFSVKS